MITIGQIYEFKLNGNHLCKVTTMALQIGGVKVTDTEDGKAYTSHPDLYFCRRTDNAALVLAFEHELSDPLK